MGGGLMQLVAYGAQDIYLTGNPQITFFKVVYRRHTNFSMESIQQTWNGTATYGSEVVATISRNGDLVNRMYIEYNPSLIVASSGTWRTNIGHVLLKEIECEIGGQMIDRHYGHWLTVWNELTEVNPMGKKGLCTTSLGPEPVHSASKYDLMSYNHKGGGSSAAISGAPSTATIPLQFWFCRNPGLALPLIALQYHEVKVKVTFGGADADIFTSGIVTGDGPDPQLWVDYIYLDTDERRRFAQVSHEYLIEQLQFLDSVVPAKKNGTFEMNLNHPVKELIFTGAPDQTNQSGPAVPTSFRVKTSGNPETALTDITVGLRLNGHERFAERHILYFTRTQVNQHHSGRGGIVNRDSIGVYSFALKPEEHQPSGTCNFSRIDNAELVVTGQSTTYSRAINLYAVNYNVLRIMSGMGGLAYSN